jgi:hypothetical protein
MPAEKYGSLWSREDLILALYLYCQIPYSKTKANNIEVVRLAQLINRTPASVARKLGNFGAFDLLLASQGITGLSHGSKADRLVWDEFHEQWDKLVKEATSLMRLELDSTVPVASTYEEDFIIVSPSGPTEARQLGTTRLCQSFFRRAVLSSYELRCCVCSLECPSLLMASHIFPWALKEELRADPRNGLCLCALHDRAFDRGLITITPSFEIFVSETLMGSRVPVSNAAFAVLQGKMIRTPRRFAPLAEALRWHNENVFVR